jgi:hypothetical protein
VSTFTGKLIELGGPELGKSGKEKPRKVVIKDDPAAQYGKTFRLWSSSEYFEILSNHLGQQVSVEYEAEEVTFGDNTWTQNNIVGVQTNGGWGNGEQGNGSTEGVWGSAPPDSGPESSPVTSPPASKDDYWERREAADAKRSLEMEAAWAVKAVLDLHPDIKQDDLVSKAISLAIVKRQVASELGK